MIFRTTPCKPKSATVQVFGRRQQRTLRALTIRRPKSAKARSRGELAEAVLRTLWGFDVNAGLDCERGASKKPA